MATQADIEHVTEACVEFIVEVSPRPLDPRDVRPHVRGTLLCLAAMTHHLGCYELVDDMIWSLVNYRRIPEELLEQNAFRWRPHP